ncbi:CheR family methyltransferase [Fictibacillus aquaticus]|uniref:protein-glutamate O-methyltransferase n=1 Tax=Fictibacillus aquaticus TaxID=2021314 RepID=A0A235FC53_9BACL|nr:protein-glutamate O-methyltransferase CheR [Fictibacillus aquaticus]OYD58527.1 chemotaxis protein CheR [Fictibacillus aquaticus]
MDTDYELFIKKIKKQTGIDLSLYKEAQMKRRMQTLKDKRNCGSFAQYAELAAGDPVMLEELLDRITINVSEFYRNRTRWADLEEKILPELLKNTKDIKIWSAACSTGEEPYTLAMIMEQHTRRVPYSILATDIDEQVLKQAEHGFYFEKSVAEAPRAAVERFMDKHKHGLAVKKELKRNINFNKLNLLADEFRSGFDLIVCRNVMIYFTDEAKEILYRKFARALRDDGILFVGSTEQIFHPGKYGLEAVEPFFYRKKP